MPVNDDVRAEIETMVAASKSAMARNDFDAALSTMTDDVVLLSASGPPVVGREAVREMYSGMVGKFSCREHRNERGFCCGCRLNLMAPVKPE